MIDRERKWLGKLPVFILAVYFGFFSEKNSHILQYSQKFFYILNLF